MKRLKSYEKKQRSGVKYITSDHFVTGGEKRDVTSTLKISGKKAEQVKNVPEYGILRALQPQIVGCN